MEGLAGLSQWKAIARADIYASTTRFRGRRREFFVIVLSIIAIWAFAIVPLLIRFLFDSYPFLEVLALASPVGLVRIVLLMVLYIIILYPSSSAVQEYKFRDWELILSCDVDTRQILVGKLVGRLPFFCLLLFALLPFLLSFLSAAYQISLAGQLLIYAEIAAFCICTYVLSVVVWSGIQARLNQSKRGELYAKIIGLLMMLPAALVYVIMTYLEQLTGLVQNGLLLILPSTWSGDLAAWIILQGNVPVSPSILPLGPEILTVLLGCYGLAVLFIGFFSADRVFTIALGARSEHHKAMGPENIFLRGIRRIWPGYWGSLVASSFKQIYRKPENVGKLAYVIVCSILPVILIQALVSIVSTPVSPFGIVMVTFFLMLITFPLMGATVFGGVGFFENTHQLWVIQSAPDGVPLFTKTRLAVYAISIAFFSIIPAIGIGMAYLSQPIVGVIIYGCAFALFMGGTLQGMGIASINPNFEDLRSARINILAVFILGWGLPFGILLGVTQLVTPIMTRYLTDIVPLLLGVVISVTLPLILIGLLLFYVGMKNLMRTSK